MEGYDLWHRFLNTQESETLFRILLAEIVWEERFIRIFGKLMLQPRLVAWQGTEAYTYSGQTLLPAPFTPGVSEMLQRVERATGAIFNTVLCNYYRNGTDSMGLHADNETELGIRPYIASLSLGAERRFRIVPNDKSKSAVNILMPAGSLLLMHGNAQAETKHELPKMPKLAGGRINLTFRNIGM